MITKEGLVQLGPETLAEALLSLRKRPEKTIRRFGEFLLAVLNPDPQRLVSLLRKEISFLKRSSRLIEYEEVQELEEHLEFIRSHIVDHLAAKDPEEALQLIQSLLELGEPTLDRILANYDNVLQIFYRACEDWGQLATLCEGKHHQWKDLLKEKLLNDKYSIYSDILFNFKSVLTQEDIDALQADFETLFREVLGHYKKDLMLGILKKIADVQDDVDLFQTYCEWRRGVTFTDCLEIAQRMLAHWRSQEALEWLSKAAQIQDILHSQNYFELQVQALELNGDYEAALETRKQWVENNLDPVLYNEVLMHLPEDQKKPYRQHLLEKVFAEDDIQKAVLFLLNTQDFDALRRFVREKEEKLGGQNAEGLRKAAWELQSIDPLAATILLRSLVEPVLEASLSREYDRVIKDLLLCQSLARKVSQWEGRLSHDLFMKKIETHYKLKTKFWSKYKSASLSKKRVENEDEASGTEAEWRASA